MALVSIQQAAANALATWLRTQFTDGTQVFSKWPEPDVKLPAKSITILLSGAMKQNLIDPVVVSSVDVTSTTKRYTYSVRSCLQNLQLDVWATKNVLRDDLCAQLDNYLNVGEQVTLGLVFGDTIRNGLLLRLGDGWDGYADFDFEGPNYIDDPGSSQANEYRATIRATAAIDLLVSAVSPKIANIIVQQKLHESKLGTAQPQTGTDVATITASGTTYTHTTP